MEYFHSKEPFHLENGNSLPGITIAYHTYGNLNESKTNVVWVCHALTANSDAAHWWPGVVGEDAVINPKEYFIICANMMGSCYGSTGPLSIDVETRQPYYNSFPAITIRDMVKAHILLRKELGINNIRLLMGGSMGGYQALEWCAMENDVIRDLFLIATSATESPWGIAVHSAQRLAIEADSSWQDRSAFAGRKGLKAARAIGILTYRNYGILAKKQADPDIEKMDNYRASSYVDHQGEKLINRFYSYSYWLLTKAMDSHHLARARNLPLEAVLHNFSQRALIVGINSDILCPLDEQRFLANHIKNSELIEIDSAYGHDGFMVESQKISFHLREWIRKDNSF